MDIQHAELFRLDRIRLTDLARGLREGFATAEPFPHVVIPDFLPLPVARELAGEFPSITDQGWVFAGPGDSKNSGDINIEKVQNSREEYFPPLVRHVMHEFNSSTFLDFLTELTAYSGLLSDPWFGGCGLHSTGRGGRLMIHADQDRHPNEKLHQMLNAIYYVTPNWQDEWGGQLELWDRDAKTCVKRISPTFNSLVIFYTGAKAFHGHPHPLQCPSGVRRNSMAAYYYTTDRALNDDYDGRIPEVIWKRTSADEKRLIVQRARRILQKLLPQALFRKVEGVWEGLKR